MDEVPEIQLCDVINEIEAILVVNLLKEEGIPARSDASPATPPFGGLPFDPGHRIFVPASMARRSIEILSHYPHFKDLKNLYQLEP